MSKIKDNNLNTQLLNLRSSAKLFSQKVLQGKSWSKMDEMFDAISEHPNVAVRSGHATSKSFTFARIGLWFLTCYPPAKVIMTAPTGRQTRDILWSEVVKAYAPVSQIIGGKMTLQRLEIQNDYFMLAFKSKDYDPNAFQGFHSPNIMLIYDEACGIARPLWEAGEGLKIGTVVKHLVGGQPFDPISPFAECFKSPMWHKIHISCLDSPNITGECKIEGLVDRAWVEDKKLQWGEDSPLYRMRVLGEFPESSADTLITLAQIQSAIERERETMPPLVMGVDVARYGGDRTVFTIMDVSGKVIFTKELTHLDLMTIVGETINLIKEYKIELTGVDVIGVGGGVVDRLLEQGYKVKGVNVAESSTEPEKFMNLRAQIYWALRENITALSLPDNSNLVADLSDIRYKFSSAGGKIQIESKEDMKKRSKRSPDYADSLVIAYYMALQLAGSKFSLDDIRSNRSVFDDKQKEKQSILVGEQSNKNDW